MMQPGVAQASPSRRGTVIGVVVWLVLIGAFLAGSTGGHFVLFFARGYTVGAWLGALILLPFFYRFLADPERQKLRANRKRVGRIRRLVLLTFGAAMAAFLSVLAPLGWLLAATWMFGEARTAIPATVLQASDYSRNRYCDQSGVLAIEGRVSSMCFEGPGAVPLLAGQTVLLGGKQSAFGLLVRHIIAR